MGWRMGLTGLEKGHIHKAFATVLGFLIVLNAFGMDPMLFVTIIQF